MNDELREVLLELNRAKSNVDRLKLLAKLRPEQIVPEIPRNEEPRTGKSMGGHTAITAKEWGISREDQDELAAASHHNLAAAYDRGFYDDLMTPFLGLERDHNLRADSTVEKLAKLQAGLRRRGRHDDRRQLDPAVRRRLRGAAGHRGVGGAHGLDVLAYFVDAETAAVDYVHGGEGLLMAPAYAVPRHAGPPRPDAAGLRPLRDPRGLRRPGAVHAEGVGGPGLLQGPPGPATQPLGTIDRPS